MRQRGRQVTMTGTCYNRDMIAALCFASVMAQSVQIVPASDDIWIYPHASDQVSDAFLRCWGANGFAVSDPESSDGSTSWSCLKFDLSGLKDPGELKSAKLVVYMIAGVGLSAEDTKKWPVQARPSTTKFEEETFTFDLAKSVLPKGDKESVFGETSPEPGSDGNPTKVEIDLMKGPAKFGKWYEESMGTPNKLIGLALTSTLDPQEAGEGQIYKFHSRNGEKKLVPVLVLEYK